MDQLNELSDAGKNRLKEATDKMLIDLDMYTNGALTVISLPLLSIGQMIEFLIDHNSSRWDGKNMWFSMKEDKKEVCDALWEAVKSVLEK